MLPFCCQSLNKFVCNQHEYWFLVIVWIIQTQQILPCTENHPKQRVLVIPPYFYRIPISHSFSLLTGEFHLFIIHRKSPAL